MYWSHVVCLTWVPKGDFLFCVILFICTYKCRESQRDSRSKRKKSLEYTRLITLVVIWIRGGSDKFSCLSGNIGRKRNDCFNSRIFTRSEILWIKWILVGTSCLSVSTFYHWFLRKIVLIRYRKCSWHLLSRLEFSAQLRVLTNIADSIYKGKCYVCRNVGNNIMRGLFPKVECMVLQPWEPKNKKYPLLREGIIFTHSPWRWQLIC